MPGDFQPSYRAEISLCFSMGATFERNWGWGKFTVKRHRIKMAPLHMLMFTFPPGVKATRTSLPQLNFLGSTLD